MQHRNQTTLNATEPDGGEFKSKKETTYPKGFLMRGNRKEPRFIVVLLNWIVTGICGLEGFIYGLGFLGSVYYAIIFHFGWSTEYQPLWTIFVSLAMTMLYGASVSELLRWTQVGGFFGLIANSIALVMAFTEIRFDPVTGQVMSPSYGAVLPSIAIILILLFWDHLYIEKPSNSKES